MKANGLFDFRELPLCRYDKIAGKTCFAQESSSFDCRFLQMLLFCIQ